MIAALLWEYQWRRTRKVSSSGYSGGSYTASNVTTYVYHGWNPVAEIIVTVSGATTNFYSWGKDLSGSFDGAGGVGGLVVVNIGGTNYCPVFDGNGNIMGLINYADGCVKDQIENIDEQAAFIVLVVDQWEENKDHAEVISSFIWGYGALVKKDPKGKDNRYQVWAEIHPATGAEADKAISVLKGGTFDPFKAGKYEVKKGAKYKTLPLAGSK